MVSNARERFADELLIGERAVGFGSGGAACSWVRVGTCPAEPTCVARAYLRHAPVRRPDGPCTREGDSDAKRHAEASLERRLASELLEIHRKGRDMGQVVRRNRLRTISPKNLRNSNDLGERREWESGDPYRQIHEKWPEFAQHSRNQALAAFHVFRILSSVYHCFRILPARCHSKCHLAEASFGHR